MKTKAKKKEVQKKINKSRKVIIVKRILLVLFSIICATLIVAGNYYSKNFAGLELDEILFYIQSGLQGTSNSVISTIINQCYKSAILIALIFFILLCTDVKRKIVMYISWKDLRKKIQLYPIKIIHNHKILPMICILLASIIFFLKSFGVFTYLASKMQDTKIFDEYYVAGDSIEIRFPENKRNLILIFAESMENSIFSKENGGTWNYSIAPELENLALENINFSHNDKIGGAQNNIGSTFTAAGLISQTAGIPLLIPSLYNNTDTNIYVGDGNYMENVYTLGDVLKDNGYNLEMMMGSDGNFGGRTQYFTSNGDYKIFDVNYAVKNGYMKEEDKVWWGFDDEDLFRWSKDEIINLAKEDKPFNYIMLTADTHFTDGYLSENAPQDYPTQYENVHAYSSKCINEFIEWVKSQDFYEDTTIVVLGDHLGMQTAFYEDRIDDNSYKRTIYNVFINSAVETENSKNRQFTELDIYPTILASLGADIEGNRIGLGTNLFSNEPTLSEKLGVKYLDTEFRKKSHFYNKYIIGDNYYVMKNDAEEQAEKKKENEQN
ncbi:MAG: LTA synthase family protein [Clostridia bacterium]|nr:LTA synthase family protein [Clostridia bacterium]